MHAAEIGSHIILMQWKQCDTSYYTVYIDLFTPTDRHLQLYVCCCCVYFYVYVRMYACMSLCECMRVCMCEYMFEYMLK